MALLWDRTQQLPKESFAKVKELYNDSTLPLEVRLHLASWMEEKFLNVKIGMEDPAFQNWAALVAQELIQELDLRILQTPNDPDKFLTKNRLQEISDRLKLTYSAELVALYTTVKHCLEEEMKIVSQVPEMFFVSSTSSSSEMPSTSTSSLSVSDGINQQLKRELGSLRYNVQQTGVGLNACKQEQEAFSVEYHTCRDVSNRYEALVQQHGDQHPEVKKVKTNKELMERSLKQKYLNLTSHQSALINQFVTLYSGIKDVQAEVLDKELIQWKREQQLAGNGYPIDTRKLDLLQEWCEGLAEVLWATRQQVRQLEGLRAKLVHDPKCTNKNSTLQELSSGLTELLSNLVSGTFVVEKQPPQVMKTNTRFTSTVRLLVGGVLNVQMAAPSVSVSIVCESQANQLLVSQSTLPKRKEDYNSGDILNSQGTMEYNATTKHVSVSFRNLQLKKIKRTEKKGTESVMDEKFSVLFWTEFQVSELKFQLWTLSLPVVVIVHGNQEPQALATVVWDNGFAEWGRRPFYVPNKVTWEQAGAALNMKWTAACGSPLTEDNLYYLACKALRINNLPKIPDEYNKMVLTWSFFCKENLPERPFTFWEWFYRLLLLTQQHLGRLWKEGFIMGFVAKDAAESMLLKTQNGCFLLRFSDSELGGVTIAYVAKNTVVSLYPFFSRDLSQRSMADVIFDLENITVLYPDVPKEEFRQFCSQCVKGPQSANPHGYVKHMLVTRVEGAPEEAVTDSSMDTTAASSYDFATTTCSSVLGYADSRSPPNFSFDLDGSGGDNMDFGVDFADYIDVRQILDLPDSFLSPQNPP